VELVLRFEDYVERSRRVRTTQDLAGLYTDAIGAEGYENCILASVRGRKLGRVAWFEFPQGYADAYVERRWERIDPVLACALRASRPFFWSDAVEKLKLSDAQRYFMEECRNLKVHSGLVFPFHGPGQRLDVMSISRRAGDEPNRETTELLYAISAQTWQRYQDLTERQLFVEPERVGLTPREVEILRWCKDGKTRLDIGQILSISPKTVEFHLRNIMDKLGANNQITAVVIAIQRGLIEL
jgi:LuxR family transcriptional regulator, quorum-sensing system regulator SolR